jgi:hypothetical protein
MFDASPPYDTASDTQPEGLALMQDRAFAAALHLCGEHPITLPSGLTLLRRRIAGVPLLMLPRAAPPSDLTAQLHHSGLHRHPLILSPEHVCAMPTALRISPSRTLMQVDLRPSHSNRRAALHQNWRHQLKQAEASALRVLHRPLKPDHPMLKLEQEQARTKRYQNWPASLTSAFASVAPDQTHLFTALLRGHEVAHMLFFTHGTRATYHIGHNTDQGRKCHAHNLLLWTAMNTFAQRGTTALDLGPQTTPDIDRFKRRVGAKMIPTGGTWLRWTPLARA